MDTWDSTGWRKAGVLCVCIIGEGVQAADSMTPQIMTPASPEAPGLLPVREPVALTNVGSTARPTIATRRPRRRPRRVTLVPTVQPTVAPTAVPTPTNRPTPRPTPTVGPTPTLAPSPAPTLSPPTNGDVGGAMRRFGTTGSGQPSYVTDVIGAGAKPGLANAVNVARYGTVGDCETDDTSAFQAAADAATAQGVPLMVPASGGACYRITHAIRVTTSVIGQNYPLIQMQPGLAQGNSEQSILRYPRNTRGVWISGLRLDGGWQADGQQWTDAYLDRQYSMGILIEDGKDITIEDNAIENMAGDSIFLGMTTTPAPSVQNILINGNTLVNALRCNIAFISVNGAVVTNNILVKRNTFVYGLDFEPDDPASEGVFDVEVAFNKTSVPNVPKALPVETDFNNSHSYMADAVGGTGNGGSLFLHDNEIEPYMKANRGEGDGPGFWSDNNWDSPRWSRGTNPRGNSVYVWNNPPVSGTTSGNAPPR